jgi:hypothetical protein
MAWIIFWLLVDLAFFLPLAYCVLMTWFSWQPSADQH